MTWKLNDGSKLTLDNITALLTRFTIRLYTGSGLPQMDLVVQYGDDNPHYELGSKVTGLLSTSESSGKSYSINGYVYGMVEGAFTEYRILLRPIEYVTDIINKTYDSLGSALKEYETLDIKGTTTDCQFHAFNDYPVRFVDKIASGYIKGVYGRSYDKLILRGVSKDADYRPGINNIVLNYNSNEIFNKFLNTNTSSDDIEEHSVVTGAGTYFSAHSDYKEYYENLIYNTRFNSPTNIGLVANELLPFEPGLIINTTDINATNNTKIPKLMYVRDVTVEFDGSKVTMEVNLSKMD